MKKHGCPSPISGELLFSASDLRILIIPILLETSLSMAVGFIDTMMVSYVNEASVSGVAVINTISQLFTLLFTAFATGGAVVTSQYIGKGDITNACYSAKQLVMISAIVALPITCILLLSGHALIDLVYPGLEKSVRDAAAGYMYPIFIMYPFLAVSYSINALYRSMNKSIISLRISLLINILNVIGNAVSIMIFNLGAFGVGLATLIAQFAGTMVQLRLITRKKELVHVDSLLAFTFDWKLIKRILHIAIPSGIENSIFQIGKLIISSAIAFLGTAAIAADAIMCNITGIFNIPGAAINTAVITVVGQCCGAAKVDQAEYYSRKLLKLVWGCLLISGIVTLLLSDFLISLFSLSSNSSELAKLAIFLIVVESCLVWAPSFTTPACLRAAGDVNFSLAIAILSMWVFRVGGGILLSIVLNLGLAGIYFGVGLDWGFRALVYELRFRQGKWRKMKVI